MHFNDEFISAFLTMFHELLIKSKLLQGLKLQCQIKFKKKLIAWQSFPINEFSAKLNCIVILQPQYRTW